ncbi:hypothetical protein SK128_004150 [Halocaridina rubra]|uniref:Uncharacterized protein n=1 Tax=Halocaridina rubra TaxID=373956 RepID=A0AAN8XV30_HALRR
MVSQSPIAEAPPAGSPTTTGGVSAAVAVPIVGGNNVVVANSSSNNIGAANGAMVGSLKKKSVSTQSINGGRVFPVVEFRIPWK